MNKVNFIEQNNYLVWDIPKSAYATLSDKSILERTLNYAKDMETVGSLFQIIGKEKAKKLFFEITDSPRNSLRPQTENLFRLIFRETV